ncbi:hypothetical protein VIBNISFn118_570022 [Vibrio nigripulchritudo SFn118]|nr:hypothetical protein VIBNISFn118_570022 [Vibrio nigripulchritudo SFn118]
MSSPTMVMVPQEESGQMANSGSSDCEEREKGVNVSSQSIVSEP